MKKKWEDIDRHSNDSTLNNSDMATFNINKQNYELYCFIRIRQTGYYLCKYPKNNQYFLCIKFIEFFGKLREHK